MNINCCHAILFANLNRATIISNASTKNKIQTNIISLIPWRQTSTSMLLHRGNHNISIGKLEYWIFSIMNPIVEPSYYSQFNDFWSKCLLIVFPLPKLLNHKMFAIWSEKQALQQIISVSICHSVILRPQVTF